MNPLTNVKNLQKLNQRELELGLTNKKSWHDKYKDSAWIFVGGLPYDLTEGDIVCVFSQYGEIVNINLVRDQKTGKSKGYCFICYEDQRSTILSVDNLNGIKLLGRTLRVDHVEEYRKPKEHGDEDDLTKKIRAEGIAPKVPELMTSKATETTPGDKVEQTEKGKKRKHKEEKKKKKKSKKHSSSESSSSSDSESDSKKLKVKKDRQGSKDTYIEQEKSRGDGKRFRERQRSLSPKDRQTYSSSSYRNRQERNNDRYRSEYNDKKDTYETDRARDRMTDSRRPERYNESIYENSRHHDYKGVNETASRRDYGNRNDSRDRYNRDRNYESERYSERNKDRYYDRKDRDRR